MNLVDELHAVAAALAAAKIDYAVCGGLAVTMHGATRTTKDIDILVRREQLQEALEAIRPLGYTFAALPMKFDANTEHERHVQRVTKVEGTAHSVLDLMLEEAALAGMLDGAISVDLPEGTVRVVSRATLLRMKRMASRPQDLADIERLEGLGD